MKLSNIENDFSSQDLDLLQRQLDLWRSQHARWTRLPPRAWSAAATLAGTLGASYVARRLRLSYMKLRGLADPTLEVPAVPTQARFVEVALGPWPSPGEKPGYRAELEGGKLSLHFGSDLPAVLALAEAFWRRQR